MSYFILESKEEKPLQISFLPGDDLGRKLKNQEFHNVPPVSVGFYQEEAQEEQYDLLESPGFLLSDKLKFVLDQHLEEREKKKEYLQIKAEQEPEAPEVYGWNCIQTVGQQGEDFPRYWMLNMEQVDCVHEDSSFYPNQILKELILDGARLPDSACFAVAGLLEQRVIVSLSLGEKILQANPFGITLKKVEVR